MTEIKKVNQKGKTKNKDLINSKILAMLESRSFEKWYETHFIDYISGMENSKNKKEILADIKRMIWEK